MNKKYGKVVTDIICLTPERAQKLLDSKIEHQRSISDKYVLRYTDAIKRDLWLFDGTPIKVDWFGRLIDGQHRCKAVISSGKCIRKVLIVYGLDPEVFKVLDCGKLRTLGDAFKRVGHINYNALAAAVGLLYEYGSAGMGIVGRASSSKMQTEDAFEILSNNPDLHDSVSMATSLCKKACLPPGTFGFLHYIFSRESREEADIFFEKLVSGEGFRVKDPIRCFRDKLLFNKVQQIKMSRVYTIAIAIKAWNAHMRNQPMTKLVWRSKASPNEPFPKAGTNGKSKVEIENAA